MRALVLFVMALPFALHPAWSAAPQERVSLNQKALPMAAEEWFSAIARETSTPIIVAGPLSGKPTNYVFEREQLGSVLDDLCAFYGYTWREQKGIVAVRGTFTGTSGMPAKLAAWLQRRRQAERADPSFQECLILSRYPDEVLKEAARIWIQLPRSIRAYRIIDRCPPEKIADLWGKGLKLNELSADQQEELRKLQAESKVVWPLSAEPFVRVSKAEGTGGTGSEITRLELAYSGPDPDDPGRNIQASVTLFQHNASPNSPIYPELPPLPEDVPAVGKCNIKASGEMLEVDIKLVPMRQLLENLSKATSTPRSADSSLNDVPVSVFGSAVNRAGFEDALAASVDGTWGDDGTGGKILMPNPRKEARPARPLSPADKLRRLFWYANMDDAERRMVGACDVSLYKQIATNSWALWAIRLLELVDPAAPQKAGRPGALRIDANRLPPEGMEYLLRISARTQYVETGRPLYDEAVLRDPETIISFTWDETGRYSLKMENQRVNEEANVSSVSADFYYPATPEYRPPKWFPEQPWFLKLPEEAPDEYLDHLEKTRAWKGKLALKDVAPLAFVPQSRWEALRKKVPEFAVVTSQNRRAVQYYAVLDHAARAEMQGQGHKLKGSDWVEDMLLRAIQSEKNVTRDRWTEDDACTLETHSGIATAIVFRFGSDTLKFSIPKATDLLSQEDCMPPAK